MWRLSDRDQLALELGESPPRNAEELTARLQRLGLGRQYRVRLTTNRTVVGGNIANNNGGTLNFNDTSMAGSATIANDRRGSRK